MPRTIAHFQIWQLLNFFWKCQILQKLSFERLKILKLQMEGKILELLGRGQSTIAKQVSNN
jgi:hypothetical protein